jgi:hypothetical protein
MKKIVISLIVVLLLLSLVQIGNALTITVTNDPPDVLLNPDNPTYTPSAPNPFDLTAQLAGYTVTSSTLYVELRDNTISGIPDGTPEYVNIIVDNNIKINNDEVGGSLDPTEAYSINVLPEMNDKKLILTVQSMGDGGSIGDFYYCSATLEVTYTPVPAPPTLFLVGSGLLGLGAMGWRRKRH